MKEERSMGGSSVGGNVWKK